MFYEAKHDNEMFRRRIAQKLALRWLAVLLALMFSPEIVGWVVAVLR